MGKGTSPKMLLNLLILFVTQEIDESILACPSFHLLGAGQESNRPGQVEKVMEERNQFLNMPKKEQNLPKRCILVLIFSTYMYIYYSMKKLG